MTATTSPSRRYDLDWLRVFAILAVFLYHSTRFFNLSDWHVKNLITYPSVQIFEMFLENWMMPLIFVISGASLFYALNKGGVLSFFKDKLLRLGVPLVVGVFTHSILQVYLERISHGEFNGSFFQFLPRYFDGVYLDVGVGGNFAISGLHLWYLLVLLLFSVAFYPVFRWLKGSGRRVLAWMGKALLAFPGAAYLMLALPVLLMEMAGNDTPLEDLAPGGWTFPMYLAFFLGGFILASHEGVQERIQRQRWVSLAIGSVLLGSFLVMSVIAFRDPSMAATLEEIDNPITAVSAWALILAFMGFAARRLGFTNPRLKYANEAVLPFYILHQPALLVVGYFILRAPLPDPAKWLVIATASFALVVGLYEYGVRRSNLLRVLFGMKALPAQPATRPQAAPQPAS